VYKLFWHQDTPHVAHTFLSCVSHCDSKQCWCETAVSPLDSNSEADSLWVCGVMFTGVSQDHAGFIGFLVRRRRQGISIPWNVGVSLPDYTMSHYVREVFFTAAVTEWSHFMQGMRSRKLHNSRTIFSIGRKSNLRECVFKALKTTLSVGNFCFQRYF